MILQSDKELNTVSNFMFEEYGCALFCLVEYAVKKKCYVFDKVKFLSDCSKWRAKGIIDMECTVLSWDKLCIALNLPYRIVIEGTHKLNRKPKEDEIQMLRLFNMDTGFKHFCNADNRDNVTYDPLGESTTAKAYYDRKGVIISRRIFKRV